VDKNSGEQFVAYFLPTDETTGKQARDAESEVNYDADDEYDFKLAREYTWNVKTKETGLFDENYYFIVKDDAIYYNCLETRFFFEIFFGNVYFRGNLTHFVWYLRVRLSKRRSNRSKVSNTRLAIRYRDFNAQELRFQVSFFRTQT
jgi:RNA polymerase II-associated factor 1